MDRRLMILSGLAVAAGGKAVAQGAYDAGPQDDRPSPDRWGDEGPNAPPPAPPPPNASADNTGPLPPPRADDGPPPPDHRPSYSAGDDYGPAGPPAQPYEKHEIVDSVSNFLGVTAEAAGTAIERIFRDNGRPTAYIAGTEGSGAFVFGLRYGDGLMYMKGRDRMKVFWQGPTGGFDFGANVGRVFTLCYMLEYPDAIFRRFPGVDGSAYFIGGLGVNYQRADGITLAPVRAGLGLRLGASVGYLAYSRRRNVIPL